MNTLIGGYYDRVQGRYQFNPLNEIEFLNATG
jgi:hypothetical protein